MMRIVLKFRKWWWYGRIRGRGGGGGWEQDLTKVKNVVSIRASKGRIILMMFSFFPSFPLRNSLPTIRRPRSTIWTPGTAAISTKITYPMKYWCILQKYIFQPLLLLQSVPCHHIVSEMYSQPNRPQMHANSASR